MTSINQANAYLKRNGDDSGMLNNLKMNNRRITNVGQPVNASDAVTLYTQNSAAKTSTKQQLPRMTSNSTPFPYSINSRLFDVNTWKCASANDTDFWQFDELIDYVEIELDTFHLVNSVSFDLINTTATTVEVFVEDDLLVSLSDLTGLQYVSFPYQKYLRRIKINFINLTVTNPLKLRDVFVMTESLVVDKPTTIHLPIMSDDAINTIVLDDVIVPLSNVEPEYLNADMTSDNTPTPYVCTSSPVASEGYEAYKAFNFDLNSNFQLVGLPVSGYLQYDCSVTVVSSGFEVCGSTMLENNETKFTIAGSVDGAIFTELFSIQNMPETKAYFSNMNPNAFRYYRLNLSSLGQKPIGVNCFNIHGPRVNIRNAILGNVQNPINNTDAVNKQYADTIFVQKALLSNLTKSQLLLTLTTPYTIPKNPASVSALPIILSSDVPNEWYGYGVSIVNSEIVLLSVHNPSVWRITGQFRISFSKDCTVTASLYRVYNLIPFGKTYTLIRPNVISLSHKSGATISTTVSEHIDFYTLEPLVIAFSSTDDATIDYMKVEFVKISY
jgi:hypothetical protein